MRQKPAVPENYKNGARWDAIAMFYLDVLEQFYKNGVRYLIVGGLAVNLYGVPRVTQDIDVIIATDRENILKINSILKDLGYVPRLPVDPDDMSNKNTLTQWIEERNLKAFSFYNKKDNYKVVDIVLVHPLDFEKAFNDRTVRSAAGLDIYLAALDDLIRMKSVAGRGQDLSDVEMLNKVKKLSERQNG